MRHAWIAVALASGALFAACTPKATDTSTSPSTAGTQTAPVEAPVAAPPAAPNMVQAYSAILAPGAGVSSKGVGEAAVSYDPATKTLTYSVIYKDLSGPATMAHIHGPAEPGADAGVVAPLANAPSPIGGTATLTDAQAAELAAGKYYVNVHTAANPGGEIRGQLVMAH